MENDNVSLFVIQTQIIFMHSMILYGFLIVGGSSKYFVPRQTLSGIMCGKVFFAWFSAF